MKKIQQAIFFILIIVIGINKTTAQIFDKTKSKTVQKLLAKTVTVYTDSTSAYNIRLKKAFTDFWKITTFTFQDISTGLPSNTEEGAPIFMPAVIGINKDGNNIGINYPYYVYGEALKSGNVSAEGIIAAFPINAYFSEFDVKQDFIYTNCLLRLPYMVYNLNDMLTHLKNNGSEKEYYKTIGAKSTRLATKILLIPSDYTKEWDINPNSTALFRNKISAGKKPMKAQMQIMLDEGDITYGGKFKIMSTADIIKLEQSADAGKYALFLPALDQYKYMMAYDLKTKELLYYDFSTNGAKIKSKDFDQMNKTAGL
jgi:hypothetical protein